MLCSVVINWNDQENKSPTLNKRKIFCHHIVFPEFGSAWLLKKKLSAPHLSAAQMAFFAQKKTLGLELLGYKPKVCIKKIILAALGSIEQVILYHCSTRYL